MGARSRWWTSGAGAAVIALAAAGPAVADTPEVSDPEFLMVAGYVRVGGGFLDGQARRDSPAVDGSQVSLATDLDLESPEPFGQLGLQFRPFDAWRIFAAFASGAWDGHHVQDGTSPVVTTPETFVFEGLTFSQEAIESELTLLNAELGAMIVAHEFEAGRLELGFGASYFRSELEITSLTTPGKRALESTESGAPWFGARVVMTDLGWAHLEVAGRAGFLWFGDSVAYTFNTYALFQAGLGVNLGPFVVTLRVEYQWWETHQRSNRQDEVFGLSLIAPGVECTVRF
ncbi:MAG: hypothetical protein ACYTGX_12445 [Planctomycetota bacterium]|jgi:hypothetical protein